MLVELLGAVGTGGPLTLSRALWFLWRQNHTLGKLTSITRASAFKHEHSNLFC